ncbi:MAG: four helix bundle protein [Candidatus Buchananbacteria bacterium RIFCSPLOWO2_01_FULL_56_15]|uniref:Four helix bundle protein n=2 Tax=Candidatus Buchananiibacteriota TaxID=1817903 RepID=A0A1G1YFS4_9BACT|nr:MAG: four helix bundle protein [Candidatus Buchananbacteria bacterium RIFCSPHIGHO2_02_FULL_56_16]OGY54956.1 MAG: four helix bundle protein [Candidatus Buchananbacteria bacterium RIFCSPLOWO2_01_FULL_56_15]
MFDFENLEVYRKAESFSKVVLRYLQDNKVDFYLADQLKRAALSITLNVAEGAGRFSKNDKKNFYVIARGSVYECVSVVRLMKVTRAVDDNNFSAFYHQLEELSKMLNGLIQSMRRL